TAAAEPASVAEAPKADAPVQDLSSAPATRSTLVFSGIPESLRQDSSKKGKKKGKKGKKGKYADPAPAETAAETPANTASTADAPTPQASAAEPTKPVTGMPGVVAAADVSSDSLAKLAVGTKANTSEPVRDGKSSDANRKQTLMFSGVPESLRGKSAGDDDEVSLQKLGQKYFDPNAPGESLPGTATPEETDLAKIAPHKSMIISEHLQEDIKKADQAERHTAMLPASNPPRDIEAAQTSTTMAGPLTETDHSATSDGEQKQVIGDPDALRESEATQVAARSGKFKRRPSPGMEEEWWVDSAGGLSGGLGDESIDPFSLPARRKSNRSLYALIAVAAIVVVGLFIALVATRKQNKDDGKLKQLKSKSPSITAPKKESSEVD
ncbi:MAG: hypothetical protein KDA41_08975, partial [Planctomycetales bacterium]|nr:hypothetical protein [Planctomycetales bacterium]